jgi:hypothetical protein
MLSMVPPVALDDLRPALKDRAKDSPEIAHLRDVLWELHKEDDGSTTIVFTFVLADPPDGMETWPVDELWELRRVAREVVPKSLEKALAEAAVEAGTTVDALPQFGWTVEFKPEHMPPLAPDDESLEFEG